MKKKNIQPFPVQCVTLGFELACGRHIKEFKKFFKIPVLDIYGTSEFGVLFMECEYGFIHHFPYKTYIETVDRNGRQTSEIGELIVTSFKNKYMPLIRYKTGDLVKLYETDKCQCGFSGKSIVRFEGRQSETTYSADNTLVTPRMVDDLVAQTPKISFYQMEQVSKTTYVFRYVSDKKMSKQEEARLIFSFKKLYGYRSTFTLQKVENIPVSQSGKYIVSFRAS